MASKLPYIASSRKAMNIPSAEALDVSNHNLEAGEVVYGDCIKSNVEEDQGPLEKGIDGVSWSC